MNSTLKYSYMFFALTALTGCTTTENLFGEQHVVYNREYDYLHSSDAAYLQVPPGVDSSQLRNNYLIPGTAYPQTQQRPSLTPPGSMSDLVGRGQLPVSIIKSDQIPSGPMPSSNYQMSSNYAPAPTISASPEMATSTMPTTHPATAMQSARVTIAHANPNAGLVNVNTANNPHLTFAQSPDKVWVKLGSALQQAGYKVILQDSRVNIYYILDVAATNGKVQKNTPMYQVHVTALNAKMTSVSITDNNGGQINNAVAQRLLNGIHRNI